MGTIITIAIFLGVLFVLILVHEWGHYIVAKLTGMRVDEFAIGFPPKLVSWKRGETEYSLNAIPVGGFVRIYGEDSTQVAEQNVDQKRAFGARPKWAQALVLVAGVTMNVIFAWFLFILILLIGVPTQVEEGVASAAAELVVMGVLPGSPADGVLPPHVTIVSVRSGEVALERLTPATLSDLMASATGSVTVGYVIGDASPVTVEVTPVKGLLAASPDRAAVGVSLSLVETISMPLLSAIPEAARQTVHTTGKIAAGLYALLAGAVVGTADFSQVAGPVGIVSYVGDAAAIGFTSLLLFTAIISLNLAVINLLPIPALDGGRLVFVAIETILRRPIPPVWAARVNLTGFLFLMLLMLAATVSDVTKFF